MKPILINFLIDVPYVQEEVNHLVNDMQNYSLTYNEGANVSVERPNASHSNTNNEQNTKQTKQGPKSSSGKDSYQIQQKGKQTGAVKGNNKI